jgi:hypothetical protein
MYLTIITLTNEQFALPAPYYILTVLPDDRKSGSWVCSFCGRVFFSQFLKLNHFFMGIVLSCTPSRLIPVAIMDSVHHPLSTRLPGTGDINDAILRPYSPEEENAYDTANASNPSGDSGGTAEGHGKGRDSDCSSAAPPQTGDSAQGLSEADCTEGKSSQETAAAKLIVWGNNATPLMLGNVVANLSKVMNLCFAKFGKTAVQAESDLKYIEMSLAGMFTGMIIGDACWSPHAANPFAQEFVNSRQDHNLPLWPNGSVPFRDSVKLSHCSTKLLEYFGETFFPTHLFVDSGASSRTSPENYERRGKNSHRIEVVCALFVAFIRNGYKFCPDHMSQSLKEWGKTLSPLLCSELKTRRAPCHLFCPSSPLQKV